MSNHTNGPRPVDPGPGTVYLLHFTEPYRHARHYCGWTTDLPARLAAHTAGRGARLVEVITDAGIGYELARTWPGGRVRERQIKNQGGLSRCCPLCGVTPRAPRPRPPDPDPPDPWRTTSTVPVPTVPAPIHRRTA